jgi:hypothetical protein
MHARRYRWVILMLLGAGLAACACACVGGSGSSGFDAFPESAAIKQALDTHQCVARAGLMICPADETAAATPTPTPTATGTPTLIETLLPSRTATPTASVSPTAHVARTPTPTASPTPLASPRIDTGVDTAAPIPCAPLDSTAACTLLVPFAPQGFGPEAVFRVAVRSLEPGAQWVIGPQPIAMGSPNAPNFDSAVAVEISPRMPSAEVAVQIAILVFRQPVDMLPAEVAELADSGADFAFVTTTVTLQPAAAAP